MLLHVHKDLVGGGGVLEGVPSHAGFPSLIMDTLVANLAALGLMGPLLRLSNKIIHLII